MKFPQALYIGASLIFLFGCASCSSTEPTTSPVVVPGVGSYFVFDEIQVDSNGVEQLRDTVTLTIVKNNLTYGRYNDVTQTATQRSSLQSFLFPGFVRFLPNGDLMMLITASGTFGQWLILPFGSQTPQTSKGDTTYIDSARMYNFAYDYTSKYDGTAQVVVGGETITMNRVLSTNSYIDTGSWNGSEQWVESFSYSPSLGVFGGENWVSDRQIGSAQNVDHQTLIKYSVK